MFFISLLFAFLLGVLPAWADGVMTPAAGALTASQSSGYDYRTTVKLQDDFLPGSGTSGSVGGLGWIFSTGTAAQQASETNRPGILRRNTTATNNATSRMYLGTSHNLIDPAANHYILWVARLNTNDATTEARVGATDNPNSEAMANGIYFEKLNADTNWFCVTRASSTQTRTDTGVAVDTAFHDFRYEIVGGATVLCQIDGVLVGTNTTNIPTDFLNPFTQINNSEAADKTMDHDYFELEMAVTR
jgi:hypothetical protein